MDNKFHEPYWGMYGDVSILKGYCEDCGGYAFVIDGLLKCCDSKYVGAVPENVRKRKRECIGDRNHSTSIKKAEKDAILEDQNYRCFYCSKRFGDIAYRGSERKVVKINWEHLLPHSFCWSNSPKNMVASCQICNDIKGSLLFDTIEEAQIYILNRRKEKGYDKEVLN